jgi:serine/threonine-protein kinase
MTLSHGRCEGIIVPQCPTCGKQLDQGIRFCPDDGTPLTDTAAATAAHTPTNRAPASRELELPTVLGNRYKLTEMMGGGGMAKVYRATDLTLERDVAVKVINPELRREPEFDARFQREARIASQLSDPHIVVVHDFGLDPANGPFLVMEYLQGMSLRERLKTQGNMPYRAALQLGGQLLLALIHAHEKGIVHRDIKPDNIFLLNQSGVRLHVRVLDFGIARIYKRDEPAHSETLTRPGAVLGTPRYMSPEQLAGQPLDARSDLYSAAMVLHEALTGQLPHITGKKLCELCPEVPQAFQDLLYHCLQANPADRPASAVEVYLRLQDLGKASGVLLLPPGALEKLSAARKAAAGTSGEPTVEYVAGGGWRRYLWIGLALVMGLAGIVLGLVALLKR